MTYISDLISQFQHFHFLRPYWFFILIVLFIIFRMFEQRSDTLTFWRNVMSPTILKALTVEGNSQQWLSPQKLSWFISVLLCLILMGPTWKQQPSPFSENNAPLIIALDLSETMLQSDIQPTRLLRAKQKILQLLTLRGDTKTALIAYAGSAHIVMPITNDREMIRHFLDVLTPKIMPASGKIPEKILPLVQQLLKSNKTPHVPGTILMIGDGATTQTQQAFEQYFNTQQNQLIVWGIGKSQDELAPDSTIMPMQLSQLKALTNHTYARLVLMTHTDEDVNIVNQHIAHNIVVVDDDSRPWHDSGYPLIFIVACLFLFWFRKGWTLQW